VAYGARTSKSHFSKERWDFYFPGAFLCQDNETFKPTPFVRRAKSGGVFQKEKVILLSFLTMKR
jgi:hypothetical protein